MKFEYKDLRNAAKGLLNVMTIWNLRSYQDLEKSAGNIFVFYNPHALVISDFFNSRTEGRTFMLFYLLRNSPILLENSTSVFLSPDPNVGEALLALNFGQNPKCNIEARVQKRLKGYTLLRNDDFDNMVQHKEIKTSDITNIRKELTNLL